MVLEGWFRTEMLVEGAAMIRDGTAKANCRYRVEQVKAGPGTVEKQAVGTVQRLDAAMAGHQKGVVYCRSKAARLRCDFHHSGMGERQQREGREAWAAGRGRR